MDQTHALAEPIGASAATRAALVEAAIAIIGEKGFDAASTRLIAARAKANIASIAYHFGSKEGLHRACGAAIAGMMRDGAGLDIDAATATPAEAAARFTQAVTALGRFMLESDRPATFIPFMLRELAHPGAAFDAVYSGMLEPVHGALCTLYAQATGGAAESDATRIAVFGLIGQVLYFQFARPAVTRRLGRTDYSKADAALILDAAARTINARIEADRLARIRERLAP